jgi:hypothetical protein
MNFWQMLRWIGIVLFLAIALAGVFGVERGQPSRTGSDADIRIAPILVR